mgnify:CR=1 FL=1
MRVPELSIKEQCRAGSIDACVKYDLEAKRNYKNLDSTETLTRVAMQSGKQVIANDNAEMKKFTQSLLSGSSFQ